VQEVSAAHRYANAMTIPLVKRRARSHAAAPRTVVAVIGSGRSSDPHAAEVGRLIATLGYDLLTGGGRGVMEAVSRAFFETTPRRGIVIGVVPGTVVGLDEIEERIASEIGYDLPAGYPNEWVELAIYTHLPDSGPEGALASSRNHVNVLSADAIVALPGREGTESEIWLATQYGVPIVAFGNHGSHVPHAIPHVATRDALRDFLVRSLSPSASP
jgi:predicted Rossmann-fold nucleotide-binding protein